MLNATHCELFNRVFFQFAQMKKYDPNSISQTKAEYKIAWQQWCQLINQVAFNLNQFSPIFAKPHIERWCNGWQVRAHFFAYFKYISHQKDAPILSILLNRRRLTVSLNWHAYKANVSPIQLPQYNQWLELLIDKQKYEKFSIWHGKDSEYSDYKLVKDIKPEELTLHDHQDFFVIGQSLEKNELQSYDCNQWITSHIIELLPLYEACFKKHSEQT